MRIYKRDPAPPKKMSMSNDILSALDPEMALLIACSRSKLATEHKAFISEILAGGVDWRVVFEKSLYHKVVPLLHKTLTTYFEDEVPKSALTALSNLFRQSSLNSLRISGSLIKVVSLLHENDIEVLPVKGGILAEKLYGSATMRSYGDVDILVHPDDVRRSLNVFVENDYKLLPEGISQTTYLKFLKHYHHGRLFDPNGVYVELHWELSGFYTSKPMTLNSLDGLLTESTFNGLPILNLSDEMLFLFLCLHGSKHCWSKLEYLCSIAHLLDKNEDLDWQQIIELGKKYRMHKRIMLTLVLLKKIFPITLTETVESLIENRPPISKLADRIIDNELKSDQTAPTIHPMKKFLLYQPTMMDSKIDAISFILRSYIVPEHEVWSTTPLPESFFSLYYFYKPFRALTKPLRK